MAYHAGGWTRSAEWSTLIVELAVRVESCGLALMADAASTTVV
jgi:hypothetical protein